MSAACHVAHAVEHIRAYGDRIALLCARDSLKSALSAANREGRCPKARASILRMLNWVRADLRKAGAA